MGRRGREGRAFAEEFAVDARFMFELRVLGAAGFELDSHLSVGGEVGTGVNFT